jgi:glycosyltransferase involved in cell wall biosynthesis
MNVLIVVPSVIKYGIEADIAADAHPQMDYFALADELRKRGASVDLIGYSSGRGSFVKRDLLLSVEVRKRCSFYDVVFTNGENVGLPYAILTKLFTKRPRHIMIGHRLSTPKKQPFFRSFNALSAIDEIFVYSNYQRSFAVDRLKMPEVNVHLIQFHADARFFRPVPSSRKARDLVSAAGLEHRDYDVLVQAARQLPDLSFQLAAASPWSKNRNRVAGAALPENVKARAMTWFELRPLYADSFAVVVPVVETDFQAGITVVLEAMAMGRPVIVTKTAGRSDTIIDGVTGIYVPPGDASALKAALVFMRDHPEKMENMGHKAREWVLEHARQETWAGRIADSIFS